MATAARRPITPTTSAVRWPGEFDDAEPVAADLRRRIARQAGIPRPDARGRYRAVQGPLEYQARFVLTVAVQPGKRYRGARASSTEGPSEPR